MHSFTGNIRYAVRLLRKSPTFTLTAVACLGLGIGANTALFGILNTLLWKPLPVERPGNLVRVYAKGPMEGGLYQGFSYPEYLDYSRQQDQVTGLVASQGVEVAFRRGGGDAIRAFGEAVSDNYFQALGVRARLGRTLEARADGKPNVTPEVVVSHRFWTRGLRSMPDPVGKTIWLTGVAFTIVGVTSPQFNGTYPMLPFAPELWVPLGTMEQLNPSARTMAGDRRGRPLTLLGRLRPGVSLPQAQAALETVAARLRQSYPPFNRGVSVRVFREIDTHPEVYSSRAMNLVAILFLGLGAIVLAVACANLANLMLARAASRRKEIAMRLALGAGRWQLVQQLVTESMVLSLAAGGMGLLVAVGASRAVSAIRLPMDLPTVFDVRIDWRVLAFTLGASLIAGLAFGLAPALGASRPDLVPALKGADAGRSARRRRVTVTGTLTVAQVAFSLVLLVAAGLFWRSIAGTARVNPGMQLDDRSLASFSPALLRYDTPRTRSFYRALLDRVRQSPQIKDAALVGWVPLGFAMNERTLLIRGFEEREGQGRMRSLVNVGTPGYFAAVGVALRKGRPFTDLDTADSLPVAVVNETLARRAWPGQDAIGRQLRVDGEGSPWLTVVGVMADGKYRVLTEAPQPYLLRPLAQNAGDTLTLVAWGRGGHASVLSAIRREVQALDPGMPMLDVKTMQQQMAKVRFLPRAMTALAAPVAGLAVTIAAIGLYGVIAYSVGRRIREFGIRLAIGAQAGDVIGQVMRQGMRTVAVGLCIGLPMALAVGRLTRRLLVGVSPADPVVFLGALGLMLGIAALAIYLPARRASRVDPLVALRQE